MWVTKPLLSSRQHMQSLCKNKNTFHQYMLEEAWWAIHVDSWASWPLTPMSHQQYICCHLITIRNQCAIYKHPPSHDLRGVHPTSHKTHCKYILTLTFDMKAILMIQNFCCHTHYKQLLCQILLKYEHPQSKNVGGVKTDLKYIWPLTGDPIFLKIVIYTP